MPPLTRRNVLGGFVAGGLGLTALGRFPHPGAWAATPMSRIGRLPDPNKPEGTDLLPEIEHIVVLIMENHSFDNYFGVLGRGDGLALGPDGRPSATNLNSAGEAVRMFNTGTSDQAGFNVRLGWNGVARQINGGAMDGFATHSGREAMTYFTAAEIPYYHGLASQFPICDRFFSAAPAATYPNRRFMSAGTAAGLVGTSVPTVLANPTAPNGTIYERLDALGVSWANYSAGLPEIALWPDYYFANTEKVRPTAEYYDACRTDTLPSFSLITPALDCDEHPPEDIACGEQFSAGIIGALMESPAWRRSVLIFAYDEHGGFYDHVPPPPAVPPGDGIEPQFVEPADPGAEGYDRYGPRVPAVIVSPFARPNYVSSVVHDHTSILRLIETKWNIAALTDRDANASNLLDSLDLGREQAWPEPPELPPPAAGPPDLSAPPHVDPPVPPGTLPLLEHPESDAELLGTGAQGPTPGSGPAPRAVAQPNQARFTG